LEDQSNTKMKYNYFKYLETFNNAYVRALCGNRSVIFNTDSFRCLGRRAVWKCGSCWWR